MCTRKLKKVVAETGQPAKATLYIAGAVYENDVLQFIGHEEGRIRFNSTNNSLQYDYFLKDHLGNLLVTVSDKKIGVDGNSDGIVDYYTADVITASDFYPGGMQMPERTYQSGTSSYRYSINGQEKTDEIAPNTTTAEFWQYDARMVRR